MEPSATNINEESEQHDSVSLYMRAQKREKLCEYMIENIEVYNHIYK